MLLQAITYYTFTTVGILVQLIYAALSAVLILFGVDLLNRYLAADKRTRQDAAYMVFFIISMAMIGYGINLIPTIVNYFYIREDWVLALQQYVVLLIVVPFGVVAERLILKDKFKFSPITILGGLITFYMTVIVLKEAFDGDKVITSNVEFYPAWIAYALFGLVGFFGFLIILFKKLSPQKEIKKKILWGLLVAFFALGAGVIQGMARTGAPALISQEIDGNTWFMIDPKHPGNLDWWYVWGALMELAAWLIMRHIFLGIPNYSELEWRQGMIELHVILAETGISLYYLSLSKLKPEELKGDLEVTVKVPEDENRPNTDLVAGGLIGIKGMLSEISGDRGKLENIQIGQKSLIFKQGDVVMALLLADKNLGVYHYILEELVREIEKTHPNLAHFNGDTRSLHIAPIVEKVFDLKLNHKKDEEEK